MSFCYTAFGLAIKSDFEIEGLFPTSFENKEDVSVVKGRIPLAFVLPPQISKPFTKYNGNEFSYEVPGLAKYYVSNGMQIIVEPENGQITSEVLLYFYSNCLAALLYQRNQIPFHTSGIVLPNHKVLLFAAPSRTGKSTLCLRLREMGYQPFTDDVAVILSKPEGIFARSSYPMQKLWDNVVDQHQDILMGSQKICLSANYAKFGYTFHDSFCSEEMQVAGITFLKEDGDEIAISILKPIEALKKIAENIYRSQWVVGMGKQKQQHELITKLAAGFPCWQAVRPRGKKTYQAFAEAIERAIVNGE